MNDKALAHVTPTRRSRRVRSWPLGPLFGIGAWLLFALLALLAWPFVIGLPDERQRRVKAKQTAMALLRALHVPVTVEGQERLTATSPRILIANHTSYIDVLALLATLPPEYAFVAKAELRRWPGVHAFLRGLGTIFVERHHPAHGRGSTDCLRHAVASGKRLIIFPEGTFRRQPGLQPFRMGAFVVAAELGIPIMPLAIRGARAVLPARSWIPRPGPVTIRVGEPFLPATNGTTAPEALRDAAYAAVLRLGEEPAAVAA